MQFGQVERYEQEWSKFLGSPLIFVIWPSWRSGNFLCLFVCKKICVLYIVCKRDLPIIKVLELSIELTNQRIGIFMAIIRPLLCYLGNVMNLWKHHRKVYKSSQIWDAAAVDSWLSNCALQRENKSSGWRSHLVCLNRNTTSTNRATYIYCYVHFTGSFHIKNKPIFEDLPKINYI